MVCAVFVLVLEELAAAFVHTLCGHDRGVYLKSAQISDIWKTGGSTDPSIIESGLLTVGYLFVLFSKPQKSPMTRLGGRSG